VTVVWRRAPWTALIFGVCAALTACSDSGSDNADGAAGIDGGACGTHAHPGVLKLAGVSPAPGSTVVNQGIVHGFVVVNAPAVFTNFNLNYGVSHTAGLSTPADLKFSVTASASGSDLIYQLTVDRWAYAPGHVELEASGGYDTLKGCSWVFPSPLFSYDVLPVLDAGAGEAKGAIDGEAIGPYDGPTARDVPSALDAPGAVDSSSEPDVPLGLDGPSSGEASGETDGGLSAMVDATADDAPAVDAGMD
jgi:hypothetical protein